MAEDTVQLTGRAARYIQLLLEFGLVDPDTANRVVVGVAEMVQGRVADVADVRRAAAMVLFPSEEEGPALDGVLAEDWPLLFS